ncbi:MAG: ABC transporter ATP-binding protein [Chlamydiia bacterium]|nr:ABC transporter ATP-binding protein [Chlamydiia bacterium]
MIELEDVSFGYDQTMALKNVSIKIQPNEYVGIIGPNGGGKTTLLKLILGFLKPQAGKITVNSRLKIGYVPQLHGFDKSFPLSVLELVGLGDVRSKDWKQKALCALEKVNLLDFAHRPFSSLSGGQFQRALIARALMIEPSVLILDEPTANLDVEAQEDVHTLLRSLKKQITIIMVSHDLQTIVNEVDRVLCVQGKVTSSLPSELCKHFAVGLYHKPLLEKEQK